MKLEDFQVLKLGFFGTYNGPVEQYRGLQAELYSMNREVDPSATVVDCKFLQSQDVMLGAPISDFEPIVKQ